MDRATRTQAGGQTRRATAPPFTNLSKQPQDNGLKNHRSEHEATCVPFYKPVLNVGAGQGVAASASEATGQNKHNSRTEGLQARIPTTPAHYTLNSTSNVLMKYTTAASS